MPAAKVSCKCCNQSYEAHLMVACCICKNRFKNTCVDISANEIRTLNNNKGYSWTCVGCRSMGDDIKDLKSLIIDLQNDIKQLRADKNLLVGDSNFDFEEVVAEVFERQKRIKNIILFNIPECNQLKPTSERIEQDKREVSAVLDCVMPDLVVTNIKPVRLGTFCTSKIRPVKIVLENERAVLGVLRNARKLREHHNYKNIIISADRTKKQLAHYKMVKQELTDRTNAGEPHLKIKYVNQIPRVVSVN